MLEDDRRVSVYGVTPMLESVRIPVRHYHALIPWNVSSQRRNRKASFRSVGDLAQVLFYVGVRIYLERLSLLVESLQDEYPVDESHLSGGESHSVLLRGLDGREHLAAKGLHFRRGKGLFGEVYAFRTQKKGVLTVFNGRNVHHFTGSPYYLLFFLAEVSRIGRGAADGREGRYDK